MDLCLTRVSFTFLRQGRYQGGYPDPLVSDVGTKPLVYEWGKEDFYLKSYLSGSKIRIGIDAFIRIGLYVRSVYKE